ncbi:MAG: hypothetical protein AAF664_26405, partial [Planctomycetota bacterium]
MIVPDDQLCILQMLSLEVMPEDIEEEYGIRIRMYHRQGAGGPIGPIALIDMLRHLGYECGQPKFAKKSEQVDWRKTEEGTPVQVQIGNEWSTQRATFQGMVSSGTLCIERDGKMDEFNAFDVRLVEGLFPSDVDPKDMKSKPDAPINQVERGSNSSDDGDIGDSADAPPKQTNWGNVKKGTP